MRQGAARTPWSLRGQRSAHGARSADERRLHICLPSPSTSSRALQSWSTRMLAFVRACRGVSRARRPRDPPLADDVQTRKTRRLEGNRLRFGADVSAAVRARLSGGRYRGEGIPRTRRECLSTAAGYRRELVLAQSSDDFDTGRRRAMKDRGRSFAGQEVSPGERQRKRPPCLVTQPLRSALVPSPRR